MIIRFAASIILPSETKIRLDAPPMISAYSEYFFASFNSLRLKMSIFIILSSFSTEKLSTIPPIRRFLNAIQKLLGISSAECSDSVI